jgi:predicted TPR repeat methyltransferase
MDIIETSVEAETLRRRAAQLIDAGRTGAARPLLAAARSLSGGDSPELSLVFARLFWRDGDLERSLRELDDAISDAPSHCGLRKCRSELRHQLGDLDAATRDAAEAVIADHADAEAKALLGSMLLELGRIAEAIACLSEAVSANPGDAAYREAFAKALEAAGDTDRALRVIGEGIALSPGSIALRNSATLICLRRRDFAGAVRLADHACAAGVADSSTFGMKGHALASLGEHDGAALAYQEALRLGPNDPHVRHLVMASGALPGGKRAPAEYITTVFDGYADRFETHLIALGYVAPVLIRRALEAHPNLAKHVPLGPVLDLGCGTGLVALAIGDLPLGPLTGVDLSRRMIEQARAKRLYAELREADIVEDLKRDSDQYWPIIIAADVVVYFGELEELFCLVSERLEANGWFLFSIEDLLPDHDGVVPGNGSWALHRLGRYAHTSEYVHECLEKAGFRTLQIDRQPMRQEAGIGVPSMLIVAEKLCHEH